MGAIDASLTTAPILVSRYKTQLRRSLPSDCRGYFRTEPRSFATERNHRISNRHAGWDEHVHQEAPAIRGRKNVLDEQIVDAIANVAICECEV